MEHDPLTIGYFYNANHRRIYVYLQTLQDVGGWQNRDIIKYFTDYARACFKSFGDRVSKTSVVNKETNSCLISIYMHGMRVSGERFET